MKTNTRNPLLTTVLAALAAGAAHAGTLWFDGGTANIATNGDGASAGLAGNWNTTLINWDQGADLPHVAWDNSAAPGTVAAFGGNMGNNNRAVTITSVNAVDLVFSVTGTTGGSTRWTLTGTGATITLGDSVTKKASIDASAMLGSSTVGVNVISALTGDVSGGLTLIGADSHMEFGNYAAYFNGLNPTRRNLLSLSNLGINNFTGPVTIKNALEIQGLAGSRFKALGPATNAITLDNGTIFLYTVAAARVGTLDQPITVSGINNALNLNNSVSDVFATISNSVISGAPDVLWSVAGTTNGRLTYTGDLSGFAGTMKIKGSTTGATIIDTNTFGGTLEVDSGSLFIGNNTPRGTLGSNNVLNNGTIVFNRSDDYSYAGAISGMGGVTKQGAGTVTLAGANTYEGLTTVTAGRLAVSGSLTGNVSVTGGRFDLSGALTGNISVTGGRFDLSGLQTGDITVTGGAISGTGSTTGVLTMGTGTAILLAGGASTTSLSVHGVDFAGPTALDFATAPVATTVYDVLTYGDGGAAFPEDFASYVRGTLVHNALAKKFTFTAAEPKSLTWDGATGDWDQIGAANWNSGTEKFYDWDTVAFNNPFAPATVTLVGTLRPASVTVTNSTGNDYTFSGSGSIAGGGTLAKAGDGALVLTTSNSYAGGTTVNAGILRLEHASAAGVGPITIGNATLSLYRAAATTTYPNTIVSASGTTGLLTVDGSGTDAGGGTNSTYTLGGIRVDGTLTVTRPTGGNGATQYNGPLSGSGTLVIGDNNGGVDLTVETGTTNRGRVLFANGDSTFNGDVRVLARGNFMSNTVAASYRTLTIEAGGAITIVEPGSGGQTTVGRFNGEGIVARNTQSGQVVLAVGGANEDDSFSGIIDDRLWAGGAGRIGFTKDGDATQTLSGAGIRHAGTTTVNGGKLKLVDTTAWASAIVFGGTGNPVLEIAGSAPYTIATAITGGSANASLVKSSGDTLTLNGANTFVNGGIAVQAGTLKAGNNQAFGADGTTLTVANGAAVDTGGTLSVNRDYHAVIQGTGVEGTGVITNSTATDRTAGFRSLTLVADATIGGTGRWDVRPITAGEGLVNLDGKTLTKTGTNLVALVNGTITAGTIQVNEGRLALTRCYWNSGTVNIAAGATLLFENNSPGQFGYSMDMTLADATLAAIGNDAATAGTLGFSGANTVDVAVALTQSGVVSGSGSLLKTGAGTFTLGAADHTYGGAITVSAGTLLVNGTKSGAGALTVQTAATLGGTGTISGDTTIEAGGFVAPGSPGVGTLTLASATLAGTYQCQIDGASADRINITGTLTLSPGATVVFTTLAAPTEPEYVIATYGGLVDNAPTISGLPTGYEIDDSTPGVIKLVRTPYYSWAEAWTEPPLADKAPGADPDNDGVSNLLEYILGGDPRLSDTGILPKPKIDGEFLVLSYRRNDASEADTTQTGQWSVDFDNWNDIAPVLVNENDEDPDDMEIRIPLSNAVNGKLFGRLKAGN